MDKYLKHLKHEVTESNSEKKHEGSKHPIENDKLLDPNHLKDFIKKQEEIW